MKRIYVLLILLVHLVSLAAQHVPDDLVYTLDSVDVSALRNVSPLRGTDGGMIRLDMEYLEGLPKFLGNTDPVSVARMFPGVRTSCEYDGRLNIDGGAGGHNYVSLNGVPLYNVNHLLGFFSTFIPSHYKSMSLGRTPSTAQSPNRIGGMLSFYPETDCNSDKIKGELTAGLISTQGTVIMPTGRKSRLTVSLRDSYINLLYSRWMKTDDLNLNYSFFDSNVTWACQLNEKNKLVADAYWGKDVTKMYDVGLFADIDFTWGNNAEAVHWIHNNSTNSITVKQTAYRTEYGNRFDVRNVDISMQMPTGITDWGYSGTVSGKRFVSGIEAVSHSVQVQSPVIEGTYNRKAKADDSESAWECSAFIDYTLNLAQGLNLSTGLRGCCYFQGYDVRKCLDPSLTISYQNESKGWDLSLNITQRHQFLFQTGVTDFGLPIEFWLLSDKDLAPQYMRGVTLSGGTSLFEGRYSVWASLYYRKLYNQLDYYGSLIDFLATDYSVYNNLISGQGRNYGADLLVTKNTGKITGWVSYSYGRALRTFDYEGMQGTYPASHERIHELDLLLTYKTGKRWEPSCVFVAAGGTPFTAPEYFYIMNQHIVTQYGEYHAHRLDPYIRMDLSVNVKLNHMNTPFIKEHGLSVNIYNVLCRANDIAYQMKIYNDKLYYHHVTFALTMLPSISYYCKF